MRKLWLIPLAFAFGLLTSNARADQTVGNGSPVPCPTAGANIAVTGTNAPCSVAATGVLVHQWPFQSQVFRTNVNAGVPPTTLAVAWTNARISGDLLTCFTNIGSNLDTGPPAPTGWTQQGSDLVDATSTQVIDAYTRVADNTATDNGAFVFGGLTSATPNLGCIEWRNSGSAYGGALNTWTGVASGATAVYSLAPNFSATAYSVVVIVSPVAPNTAPGCVASSVISSLSIILCPFLEAVTYTPFQTTTNANTRGLIIFGVNHS